MVRNVPATAPGAPLLSPGWLTPFAFLLGRRSGDESRVRLDLLPAGVFWVCRRDGPDLDGGGGGGTKDCDRCEDECGEGAHEGGAVVGALEETVPRTRSAFQLPAHNVRMEAAASSSRSAASHCLGKKVLK